MDWPSVVILGVAVWLAIYVLVALMAQHRRELLAEWRQRRQRQVRLEAQQRQEPRAPEATSPPPDADATP